MVAVVVLVDDVEASDGLVVVVPVLVVGGRVVVVPVPVVDVVDAVVPVRLVVDVPDVPVVAVVEVVVVDAADAVVVVVGGGVARQSGSQPSPATALPSSHASPPRTRRTNRRSARGAPRTCA
jgi:hypothetical protein